MASSVIPQTTPESLPGAERRRRCTAGRAAARDQPSVPSAPSVGGCRSVRVGDRHLDPVVRVSSRDKVGERADIGDWRPIDLSDHVACADVDVAMSECCLVALDPPARRPGEDANMMVRDALTSPRPTSPSTSPTNSRPGSPVCRFHPCSSRSYGLDPSPAEPVVSEGVVTPQGQPLASLLSCADVCAPSAMSMMSAITRVGSVSGRWWSPGQAW